MKTASKMDQKNKSIAKYKTFIEEDLEAGVPVYYARFYAPVSPMPNKEPVFEFKLTKENYTTAEKKYLVDKMILTKDLLIFWPVGSEHYECIDRTNAYHTRPVL